MEHEAAEGQQEEGGSSVHVRHIKKRALKNKSISVSFDEKDLKDYVTGFHKRKKKRRKEAVQNQEAAYRRKQIELRAKRKLDRESVYGIKPESETGTNAMEPDEELEDDEEAELIPSVSGMTTYDNGDMQVIVKTSEITQEEEELPIAMSNPELLPQYVDGIDKKKQKIPVIKRKKPIKNVKRRSTPKPLSKREKRKGKNKSRTEH